MSGKKSAKAPPAKKRIVVVDDHPIMRSGVAMLINNEPGLIVCGEAENAAQAMELIAREKPDLVLADISLPDKNGLELVKDIQALHPGQAVLVLSMHDEAFYAERVLRAGGRGYLMKQEGGQKLKEAIHHVLAGQIYVSQKMSVRILEMFSGRSTTNAGATVENLTDREFEVFQSIGEGKSTREIADKLHISVKTVEVHRANIKTKLKVGSAAELVHYAVRWAESRGTGA
jgi:DNA-binding NarL/FixJ family response regulator